MLTKEVRDLIRKYVHPFRITKGQGFQLKDFDPADTCGVKMEKGEASDVLLRRILSANSVLHAFLGEAILGRPRKLLVGRLDVTRCRSILFTFGHEAGEC